MRNDKEFKSKNRDESYVKDKSPDIQLGRHTEAEKQKPPLTQSKKNRMYRARQTENSAANSENVSVETKIDGLSMTLRYEKDENGLLRLSLAETRGDGLVGEDVTANALVVPDVKKYLKLPYDALQLRGEVYMSHSAFEKYNDEQEKTGKKLAANPRNLAAGTLRQLNPAITKERGLKMFVFNVQQGPEEVMESRGGVVRGVVYRQMVFRRYSIKNAQRWMKLFRQLMRLQKCVINSNMILMVLLSK